MAGKVQLVVFKVGSEEFAVDIMHTKEVVVPREITPVPETQDYVEGVMNLRGNLIPVVDFRRRLRAECIVSHPDRRIIIANMAGKTLGLIVDSTSEVIRVDSTMVEAAPDIISEIGADYVAGVVNFGGRFIVLLDLAKALDGEIKCELEEVLNVLSRRKGVADSIPQPGLERVI